VPWDVFLSYSGRDLDDAAGVAGALRAAGLSVWFDRLEVRADDRAFPSTISEGLVGARLLCVLCTPSALKSEWVQRELMQFVLLAGPSARRQAETGICFLSSMAATAAALPSLDEIGKHGVGQYDLAPEEAFLDLSANLLEAMGASLRRGRATYVPDGLERLAAQVKIYHGRLVPPRPTPPAGDDLAGRLRQAERFWRENDLMARSGWTAPDFAALLPRLDAFRPPHDRWPQQPETARGARIRTALESVLAGPATSAANVPSQKSAHAVFDRYDLLITLSSEGSPVRVLEAMAVDANILDDLQQVYYDVRAKLFDEPGFRDLGRPVRDPRGRVLRGPLGPDGRPARSGHRYPAGRGEARGSGLAWAEVVRSLQVAQN
jgi:hypothetical protein